MPQEDRPREKLARLGAAALSDSELIISPSCSAPEFKGRMPSMSPATLLQRFQSLGGLARCSVKEIASIKGVGPAKAVQLVAAFGLGTRLARESLSKSKIDSPELVYELLGQEMRALARESAPRDPARHEIPFAARRGNFSSAA